MVAPAYLNKYIAAVTKEVLQINETKASKQLEDLNLWHEDDCMPEARTPYGQEKDHWDKEDMSTLIAEIDRLLDLEKREEASELFDAIPPEEIKGLPREEKNSLAILAKRVKPGSAG